MYPHIQESTTSTRKLSSCSFATMACSFRACVKYATWYFSGAKSFFLTCVCLTFGSSQWREVWQRAHRWQFATFRCDYSHHFVSSAVSLPGPGQEVIILLLHLCFVLFSLLWLVETCSVKSSNKHEPIFSLSVSFSANIHQLVDTSKCRVKIQI